MARRWSPSVMAATAAAGAVLALAAAVVDPYLAAAGDAATATELARLNPEEAGLRVVATGAFAGATAREVAAELDAAAGAGPASTTVRADPATLVADGTESRMRLVGRTDGADLLEIVEGAAGDGLLLPQRLAAELDAAPGDALQLQRGSQAVGTRVAGIYRELDPVSAPPALADLAALVTSSVRSGRPLDLVFADPGEALDLMVALGGGAGAEVTWRVAVTDDLTGRGRADAVRSRMQRVAATALEPRSELGGRIAAVAGNDVAAEVGLTGVLREANRSVSAVSTPARISGFAGQAVALVVVGMTALFAARQRATELRLENVRGRALPLQGLRAALRALPALVVGAALGWTAAVTVVAVANAPRGVPRPVLGEAAVAAGTTLVPALLVVGATTAVVAGLTVRVGRVVRIRRLRRFPWELVVLGLAAVAFLQLRTGGGLRSVDGVDALSPLVLAFPLLLLAGAVGLAIRGLRRGLPRLRRVGRDAGAAPYLAVRRLAAAQGAGLLLTGAAATALGLVVYTAALSGSLQTAVQEKSVVQLGAAAVAPTDTTAGAADGTTTVHRYRGRLGPGEQTVDVLLVDPATFAAVAFWREELLGAPMPRLLTGLQRDGQRLPVLLAGGVEGQPTLLDVPGFRVPIEVTARPDVLPGQTADRPILLASTDAADAMAGPDGADGAWRALWRTERWASGDDAVADLVAAGADPDEIRTSAEVAARSRLVAVSWALGALQALALLATGLALIGILVFVAVRQRDLQVSYALSRRMGLRSGTHAVALLLEVLALLALALGLATVLGLVAALAVTGGIDPLPELLPAPRVVVPLGALGVLVVALAGAGGLGAATLQRAADRANVAEVLRG